MDGGRTVHTNPLTRFVKTAGLWCLVAVLAVFFSQAESRGQEASLTNLESGISELVFGLSHSIVAVEAVSYVVPRDQTASRRPITRRLVSTGLVCDSSGYILAYAPMVSEHDRIGVILEGAPVAARLVAIDYASELALLQAEKPIGQAATLSSRQVCAGQMVLAVGNSYGLRAAPSLGFCAGVRVDGLMQFVVPLSSTTIGGGVFDMGGKLLGVIVGGANEDGRIALAVPAHRLPELITHLRTRGDRQAGYLGIESADIEIVPPLEFQSTAVPASAGSSSATVLSHGVFITSIVAGSPASQAGLARGDLIVSFDGTAYTSAAKLARAVQNTEPGRTVAMEIVRDNRLLAVDFRLGRKKLRPTGTVNRISTYDVVSASLVDSLQQAIIHLQSRLRQLESEVSDIKQ